MNLRDATMQAAVLKVIGEAVAAAERGQRAQTLALLKSAHAALGLKSVEVNLPDGTPVGTVALTNGDAKPTIDVDEAGLMAFVEQTAPGEIMRTINPAFEKAVRRRLTIHDGKVVDRATGEVVSWATVVPANPHVKNFSVRLGDDGRDAVRAALSDGRISIRDVLTLAVEAGERP